MLKFIKKYHIIRHFVIILIVAIISSSLGILFAVNLGKVTLIEFFLSLMPQQRIGGFNILVVGIDETKKVQRSDTIIVIHLDTKKNRIGVISIPRDTRINVDGIGLTKINHSYAYGNIDLLRRTVSDFLNIPIHRYVKVNLKGVQQMIDEIGGITLNIEKDLYYIDKAGDLYIDLKKGKNNLSGQKAISYLRFRHDQNGDIGRIRRQQTFLRAVLSKILESGDILKTPSKIKQLIKNIETDLSIKEIISLAVQINKIYRDGQIETGTIPGAITIINHVSYWKPDVIAVDRIVDQVLLGFEREPETISKVITVDNKSSQDKRRNITLKEVARIENQVNINEDIKYVQNKLLLEVLNGYGQKGGAQQAARLLKEHHFKVAWFGNAGSYDYDKTLIVDWKGNVQQIMALAKFLFIDPSRIIIYHRPQKKLDATIVLGKDWAEIATKIENKYSNEQINNFRISKADYNSLQ